MKKTMEHEEIKAAFSDVYNRFYLQHRLKEKRNRTTEEWEKLVLDSSEIVSKYNSELVAKLVIAVVEEFEAEDEII